MVAGSHAAMYYGEPRLTRDVDIIAMLTLDGLPAMLQRFPADQFYERYLTEWADRLGVRVIWERARRQAG